MRRREFIGVLGAAVAWPPIGLAQQPSMPVVGFLHFGSPEPNVKRVAGFRKGLSEAGYVEGKNVAIEFRWAAGRTVRLPELAADLIRRQVAVIVTPASSQAALAAKAATTTVPIVFAVAGDPVEMGLVASLSRPGGNVTGISVLNVELTAKRLELLRELTPGASRFAVLANPNSALTKAILRDLQAGPPAPGPKVEILLARTDGEIEAAFANLAQAPGGALLFTPDEFLFTRRVRIVALAARHKIPTMYYARELAEIGGLISYGPDVVHTFEQVGEYAGRILKGEKPNDLPVVQSEKFEMVLNLKTAKAAGISIPESVLLRANEVIE